MGLVQKIFYIPCLRLDLPDRRDRLRVASARYLFRGNPRHDRWLAGRAHVLFGLITLITGPLWARRSWGTGGCGTHA